MAVWMYQMMNVMGQAAGQPWDETDPAAKTAEAASRSLSFSALQKSMCAVQSGETNDSYYYRNLLIAIVVGIVVVGLLLHWRQRRKQGGPPDSVRKLGRELSRAVHFPMGTRVLLWWVLISTRVPVAVLLISGEIFEASVRDWSRQPTFVSVREWGAGRLKRLERILFEKA